MSKYHFTVEFTREYTTHDINLPSDERVTVVSDPTWDSCADSLAMLENPGKYILTPELITTVERPQAIHIDPAVIASRVKDVQEISLEYPDSTILLGTPTGDSPMSKQHNGLLFIRNGNITGQTWGLPPHSQASPGSFYQPTVRPEETVQPVVGSDLLRYAAQCCLDGQQEAPRQNSIGPAAKTILASSCWITPDSVNYPGATQTAAEQYVRQICGLLFENCAQLETVVMCDRLAVDMFVEQPLNFVARRG